MNYTQTALTLWDDTVNICEKKVMRWIQIESFSWWKKTQIFLQNYDFKIMTLKCHFGFLFLFFKEQKNNFFNAELFFL